MKKQADRLHSGPVCAALALLGSFLFFQFAYPYHLMRREQLDLFLWDGDHIRQTYRGGRAGWPASPVISWNSSSVFRSSGRFSWPCC